MTKLLTTIKLLTIIFIYSLIRKKEEKKYVL